jgi:ligand-binding sensor domain-containing protein/signal transduction histidine kinase
VPAAVVAHDVRDVGFHDASLRHVAVGICSNSKKRLLAAPVCPTLPVSIPEPKSAIVHRTSGHRNPILRLATAACLCSASAAAQLPPLDQYHIRAFRPTANGLLAADVRDLAQTKDGYLYVAQARGLARYDGTGFQKIPLPGLRSEFVDHLYADRRGWLWLRTHADEVGVLADGRFRVVTSQAPSSGVFFETADGSIWIAGVGGVLRVAPDSQVKHFGPNDGLPGRVFGVFDVPGGKVLLGEDRLMQVLPAPAPQQLRFVPFGPGCSKAANARLDEKGLWLPCTGADSDYVLRYDGQQFARYDGVQRGRSLRLDQIGRNPPEAVFHPQRVGWNVGYGSADVPGIVRYNLARALFARDSAHWLVLHDQLNSTAGLVRHDKSGSATVPLRDHFDFTNIHKLLEDHEGSIWVGTDRGLFQLSRRRAFALELRHGLAEAFTVPIMQTSDDAVWVGTWGGGLHRFAGGRLDRRYDVASGLPDSRVRSLLEAPDGGLWIGTAGGYAVLRAGRIALTQRTTHEVRSLAAAGDSVWIATKGELFVHTPAGTRPYRADFWRDKDLWAVHIAHDGALWIGGEQGLFRVTGDSIRLFDEKDGLRSRAVIAINEDTAGTLWFSTYEHGLHRYRAGRMVAVTTEHGLPDSGVWEMLEDGQGGVWMSGDLGIFRLDRARLHSVLDSLERGEKPAPLAPLMFNEAEGLPSREANRASPGGWKLRDGRLLFNNIAGVVVIDPAIAMQPPPAPRAILEALIADGRPINFTDGSPAAVPPRTKQLAFDFAALSFLAPEQNRYRYRLDGYDDDWVVAGSRRRASYTNLPPGKYSFAVQGATAMSPWSDLPAQFAFVVQPALVQTWWFRVGTSLLACTLLLAAYRYRIRRLLELQALRLRIAADLHDDVGSSLSSIALLTDRLHKGGPAGQLQQHQIQRINRAARETVSALNDIVWLVDPKAKTTAEVIQKMRAIAEDLLGDIECGFEVDPDIDRALSMPVMRTVLLVYKEALHNISRHAAATEVHIDLALLNGQISLAIVDNGPGFDPATVRPGRGLDSMRRRAQQVGGTLEVSSAPGRGTRLTCLLPASTNRKAR